MTTDKMPVPTAVRAASKPSVARQLAAWATSLQPTETDLALADLALKDTLAVALAARSHPLGKICDAANLPPAAKWAAMAHVLDFDDLHTDTTTHISVVTVPATLAAGGDARAYLAGGGVFARLAARFGWGHYKAGWHITCTAGAPAAAVAAGVAMGLSAEELERAIALAVPGAGGVQEAFGTHGKSLQVGFAADAGVRAALLAKAGATAAPGAVESWLRKLGAANVDGEDSMGATPAVPGGLAIKMFPCCYAMQRPIAALRELKTEIGSPSNVSKITVTTPAGTIHPLLYDRPTTGLQGKFSLPYSLATALLDEYPGFEAFTDSAVERADARDIVEKVEIVKTDEAIDNLLDGQVELEVALADGRILRREMKLPPGAPERPPTDSELSGKFGACGTDVPELLHSISWTEGKRLMEQSF